MKLAVIQTNPTLGDIKKNKNQMILSIEKAIKNKIDLIVFPELALTGYLLEELTYDVAGIPPEFYKLSEKISILFGGIEEGCDYYYYNSAFYLEDGLLKHTHRKIYLPTYGLFDEGRYIKSGKEIKAFDTKFGRFGVLICEDAWHLSSPYLLSQDGADYIFTLVNSPSKGAQEEKLTPNKTWDEMSNTYAKLLTVFYVFAHRVGYEDGINFFGGSKVYSPKGVLLISGNQFEEDTIILNLDKNELRRARILNPVMRDEKPELVSKILKNIIKQKN